MQSRHHLPRCWLFTDPRQGPGLWSAIAGLPRGSGVIFRHYDAPDRAAVASRVRQLCRRSGCLFVVAGPVQLARQWRADGSHGRHPGALTAPAHGRAELVAAARLGVRLVFLSPVHATRSHPGAAPLGRVRFGLMARNSVVPVAALGGMTGTRFRILRLLGAVAWGAIDGLDRTPRPAPQSGQKLNAVPR